MLKISAFVSFCCAAVVLVTLSQKRYTLAPYLRVCSNKHPLRVDKVLKVYLSGYCPSDKLLHILSDSAGKLKRQKKNLSQK